MMRLRIASVSSATGRPEDVDRHSEKDGEATIAESLQKSSSSPLATETTNNNDAPPTEKKEAATEPVAWNVPSWTDADAKNGPMAGVTEHHRPSAGSGPMIVETTIEAPPLPKKKWYRRIPCF